MTTAALVQRVRLYPTLIEAGVKLQNEEVYSAGSQAQAEIMRLVEPIDEKQELTLVIGQEVYIATGPGAVAWLARVKRFKDRMFYTGVRGAEILEASEDWVDVQRSIDSGPTPPMYFYPRRTVPLSVGFWGPPIAAATVTVPFVVRHTSANDFTAAVDPLLPDDMDQALLLGTVAFLFQNRITKMPTEYAAMRKLFDAAILDLQTYDSRAVEYRHRPPSDTDEFMRDSSYREGFRERGTW